MEVIVPIRDAVSLIRGLYVLNEIGAVSHIEYDFKFGEWCITNRPDFKGIETLRLNLI